MAVVFEVFRLKTVWTAVLVASALGAAGDALAQQPSQAQLNALRSSCRGDYMAHCSSVPTGGAPALNCLKQHMAALSGGCRSAVSAISPAAPPAAVAATAPASAPAAAPPPAPMIQAAPAAPPVAAPPGAAAARKPGPAQRQAEARAIGQACRADYHAHCAGIQPGGSASIACLKRNARTLSRGCLQALVSAPAVAAAPASAPAPAHIAAPVAPPPMEPAPLLVTPREERFIIRSACGADFAAYCGGLRPGLGRIAACLHYNRSNLSPRCQQALIALHEGR
jgi:hypothetical protein